MDALSPRETRTSPARPPSPPAQRGGAQTHREGIRSGLRPPEPGREAPRRCRTSSRDPAAPAQVASARWVSPGVLPEPGAPAAPRRRLGRAARAELPGGREGRPDESCQGNLSNLSAPVPASCIIHRRRRRPPRDAGAAHLHSRSPHPGWGARRAEAGHLAETLSDPGNPGARPATQVPTPIAPGSAFRSPLLQPRTPEWGLWGLVPGGSSRVSRDLETAGPLSAPGAPPGGSAPAPPRGTQAQVTPPAGGDLEPKDPGLSG